MNDGANSSDGERRTKTRSGLLAAAAGHILARGIHVVAELEIADRLAHGPKTAHDLAAESGAHPAALHRLLHFLARHAIFLEHEDGRFSLTPTGAMLRSDDGANTVAVVRSLGSPGVWDRFGKLQDVIRSGRTPTARDRGRLYTRKDDVQISSSMVGYHAGEPQAVAAAYDFSGVRTVVDIGGSGGTLIATILLHHPHLAGIVFDRPEIAEECTAFLSARGLSGRCTFVGGDFFMAVPEGGDLYILSHILHDWGNDDAQRILAVCREAMQGGARLLVLEAPMSFAGEDETEIPADMLLLAMTEGRLRTIKEHGVLLGDVHFRHTRTLRCDAAVMLIEAEAV